MEKVSGNESEREREREATKPPTRRVVDLVEPPSPNTLHVCTGWLDRTSHRKQNRGHISMHQVAQHPVPPILLCDVLSIHPVVHVCSVVENSLDLAATSDAMDGNVFDVFVTVTIHEI